MHYGLYSREMGDLGYKFLLNKEDSIDKLIIELAEKGDLKVGFVKVKPDRWLLIKKYLPSFVKH